MTVAHGEQNSKNRNRHVGTLLRNLHTFGKSDGYRGASVALDDSSTTRQLENAVANDGLGNDLRGCRV